MHNNVADQHLREGGEPAVELSLNQLPGSKVLFSLAQQPCMQPTRNPQSLNVLKNRFLLRHHGPLIRVSPKPQME